MLGKLGLILLIVAFGACMFVAGTMAPIAWRTSIASFGDRALGVRGAPLVGAAQAAPVGKASTTSAAPPSGSAPAASGSAAVKLDSLLVSAAVQSPVPAAGQPAYALQLGQFARGADADAALQRGAGLAPGLPLARIATIDGDNTPWTVVAIGRYVSPAMAQRDAARLQAALGLRDLPVIRLPDRAPSAKPGA